MSVSNVEVENKTYFFGNVNINDTIRHTFKIKNISDIPYKIDKVGVSCGCTTYMYSKENIEKGRYAEVSVEYIPNPNDLDSITKSIVVSDNSKQGFNTFYLKGNVVKKN